MHFHNDHVLATRQSKSTDLFSLFHLGKVRNHNRYCKHAIISRGLYIFYPISKDIWFFVFKEVFPENSVLRYGLYSRAASNQERLMMARVQYYVRIFFGFLDPLRKHVFSTENKQKFAFYDS